MEDISCSYVNDSNTVEREKANNVEKRKYWGVSSKE